MNRSNNWMASSYFEKKSFLITGGGSGIGQACALYLSERGSNVFIIGRNESKLKDTVELSNPNHRIQYAGG